MLFMNKTNIIIGIFILILIVGSYSYFLYNQNARQTNLNCYPDKDISLKKAQFDFNNAYNDYPYDKKKVDFAYALQYAKCK